MQQKILSGLQPKDAHADTHRRKAIHLPISRVQQAI